MAQPIDVHTRSERALDRPPVKPRKLAHFVLRTPKFEETRQWYLNVLDAEVAYENEMVCFLCYDDEHHRVGIVKVPDATPLDGKGAGLDHVSFTFEELGELLSTYRRLKAIGIEPFWPIIHGPTISLYYRDPIGVKVELQYDVLRTPAEVNAFFAAGNYIENFMGIIFDPEEMSQRFEAGEAMETLTARPRLPDGLGPWDMHRP